MRCHVSQFQSQTGGLASLDPEGCCVALPCQSVSIPDGRFGLVGLGVPVYVIQNAIKFQSQTGGLASLDATARAIAEALSKFQSQTGGLASLDFDCIKTRYMMSPVSIPDGRFGLVGRYPHQGSIWSRVSQAFSMIPKKRS